LEDKVKAAQYPAVRDRARPLMEKAIEQIAALMETVNAINQVGRAEGIAVDLRQFLPGTMVHYDQSAVVGLLGHAAQLSGLFNRFGLDNRRAA
jgi:hypothetical protein